MPSRKTPEGEFKDIAHPINAQMRDSLEHEIMKKYQSALIEETENGNDFPENPTLTS